MSLPRSTVAFSAADPSSILSGRTMAMPSPVAWEQSATATGRASSEPSSGTGVEPSALRQTST